MVGSRIRNYLDENGIKRTFLAQRVGMSDSALSDALNEKRKIYAEEYYLICKALNVPMSKFVETEE